MKSLKTTSEKNDTSKETAETVQKARKSSMSAAAFFAENRELILAFGEYFLEKLSDKELLDALAEKDLEKLARIFKLMFDKNFTGEEKTEKEQNKILDEILGIFKTE
ncbi:MAG: hypothetical protein FWE74_07890 [Oscillospiraceae bacterium]|nr:hypothetical protein [Oscillospiraceae bacterium]